MIRLRILRNLTLSVVAFCALFYVWQASLRADIQLHPRTLIPVQGWENLSDWVKARTLHCTPDQLSLNQTKNTSVPEVSPCRESLRFRADGGVVTALASFPGSGNTWLRYLLEQTTGVLTGSVYCDRGLKLYFSGEYVPTSNVLVIKTHSATSSFLVKTTSSVKRMHFDRAVILVRNLGDALISEAHRYYGRRKQNKHLRLVSKKKFFDSTEWYSYVQRSAYRWANMYMYWLDPSLSIPILVVKYENLLENLELELRRVLDFLNQTYTEDDIRCVLQHNSGQFKRNSHLTIDPFSNDLTQLIKSYLEQASPVLSNYSINYS